MQKALNRYVEYNEKHDQEAIRNSHLGKCCVVSLLGHLEYPHPFGNVRQYARKGVEVGLDYFYGDWRDAFDLFGEVLGREQCRRQLAWIDAYRDALLCASLVGEPDALARIAAWPDTDLPADEGAWRLTPQDAAYHVLLGRFVNGRPLKDSNDLSKNIRSASRRRPKMLLDALEAIELGDAPAFEKAFAGYLKHYRRSEFTPWQINLCISMEGTILWNVAHRQGLPAPELPLELMDLVVTPESIGSSR